MKTPSYTLLTTIFLLLAFSARGQLSFGIKGSFVRSNLNTAPDLTYVGYNVNSEAVGGYATTVSLYFPIFKNLHIGIEPGLVQRGSRTGEYRTTEDSPFDCWNIETDHFDSNCAVEKYGDTRLYASYVQAPVLLKGTLPVCSDRLSAFVKAGGSFSWLASAQHERNLDLSGSTFQTSTFDLNEASHIKRWDRAWLIGAGMEWKIGPGSLLMESQYFHGTQDFYVYAESLTRSISYSLGYQINL